MLIASAFAQDAASAAAQPSPFAGMIPFVLIVVIFYFLIIRPQQKRYKDHQAMVSNVTRGDKVVTGGGIIGKVNKVENDIVHVDIADGVTVQVARHTISSVVSEDAVKAPKSANNNSKSKGKPQSTKNVANDN